MIPESRIITYGGDSGMSDDLELSSEFLDGGNAEYWIIGDNGIRVLFMVPLTSEPLC